MRGGFLLGSVEWTGDLRPAHRGRPVDVNSPTQKISPCPVHVTCTVSAQKCDQC